jgi:ApbE superfamily uncharacterized protein (UPF0280 family)
MYEPRGYRQTMRPTGLVRFTVVVEETDLMVMAERDLSGPAIKLIRDARSVLSDHIARHPEFGESFDPLPTPLGEELSPLVEQMYRAGRAAGTGPMAAVAGAVAQYVGEGLLDFSDEVIVENGGDIYIASQTPRVVSIYAGQSILNMKVGLRVGAGNHGVCTSAGTVGHSHSDGAADSAVAVSADTALADAVATELGNRVRSAADIQAALEWVRDIDGIVHAAIVVDDAFGTWGALEVVPVASGTPSASDPGRTKGPAKEG